MMLCRKTDALARVIPHLVMNSVTEFLDKISYGTSSKAPVFTCLLCERLLQVGASSSVLTQSVSDTADEHEIVLEGTVLNRVFFSSSQHFFFEPVYYFFVAFA